MATGPRKLSTAQEAALARIAACPDLTLAAMQSWLLSEHGVWLSNGAMWKAVERLGLSFRSGRPQDRQFSGSSPILGG